MDFEGVKNGLANSRFTLIDVRNPDEVAAGKIPGSFNIPLSEVSTAFALDEDAFKTKYGLGKPAKDAALVTHCLKGGRAAKGQEAMAELGFTGVQVYAGSFTDWKANGGQVETK